MGKNSAPISLNKYIAQSGLCSRRKADEFIRDGVVTLNGHIVETPATQVDPAKDVVKVNKKIIKPISKKVYYAFNKPTGVLTSLSDPEERPTISDYTTKIKYKVFPVGRLDWNTEGLLLLTNDGDFAQEISHPSSEIPKTYLAKLDGQPTDAQLSKLKKGVTIVGGRVKAIHIERHKKGSAKYDWVKIVITEGKNRQVRKMFQKIGYDVTKLKRVSIGELKLGTLKKGEYQPLSNAELLRIFKRNTSHDKSSEMIKTRKTTSRNKNSRNRK